MPARSDVATDNEVPVPPFCGDRVVKGIAARRLRGLPRRARHVPGPVGAQPARGGDGPSYEELVETEGRPRLRMWLDRIQAEGLVEAAVVYGYFRASARATTWWCWTTAAPSGTRFTFPRQRRDRHLCLADFFRPRPRGSRTWSASSSSPSGRSSARRPRSCSPRTPTATTWSCTGCRSSSPRRWRSTGTRRVREELGLGRRRPARLRRHPQGRLPRLPLLVRLPGLPGPGGPGEDRPAAAPGADRSGAVGGVPARPRAVHRRDHRASP